MNRTELYTSTNLNKIMYVYNLYKMTVEKYADSIANDEYFSFTFYNYKGLDLDVCMRGNGFFIWEGNHEKSGEAAIFSISEIEESNIIFVESTVSDDYFCYRGDRGLAITVGDHKKFEYNTVMVDSYYSTEDLLEDYPEEWFFQQMTVQNIISFEQFKKEVDFCMDLYSRNIAKNHIIEITDLSLFNMLALDGFRLI